MGARTLNTMVYTTFVNTKLGVCYQGNPFEVGKQVDYYNAALKANDSPEAARKSSHFKGDCADQGFEFPEAQYKQDAFSYFKGAWVATEAGTKQMWRFEYSSPPG